MKPGVRERRNAMEKITQMLKKSPAMLISLIKGLIGLIRGKENDEAAKKVGKILAVAFVGMCVINTAAAIHKAKKTGHWKK